MAICKNSLCGKEFSHKIDKRKKFCSRSCAASFNNIGIRRHGEVRYCLHCNKHTLNKKFCSTKCHHDFEWKQTKKKIEETGRCNSAEWGSSSAKRYLKEIHGNRCEICRNTKWLEKPIPLILDHISGDSSDWSLSNLRLVCGNCDMQLPTYKSKNRGNGRAYRRERYAEGKSY